MRDKGFFKGWYFKCSTDNQTVAFIPAIHRYNGCESASLQVITDEAAFNVPFDKMVCSERPLSAQLGDCLFSEKGIYLNYKVGETMLEGAVAFGALTPIRYDIMGPFALVPFMQCRHDVYSMAHTVNGQITVGNRQLTFHNGTGYIEGDRGSSFPSLYIWTQCCFENGSLMLSVADIPMFGTCFTGIIGVVMLNGREYRIATYLGARVKRIGENSVVVKQGSYELTAKLLRKNALPLLAPQNGNMIRTIHESASCKSYYCFTYKGKILCEFSSDRAGFEFEYYK